MRDDVTEIAVTNTPSLTCRSLPYQICFVEPVGTALPGKGVQVMLASSTCNNLAIDARTANWVIRVVKKLDAIGRLERNWDSHDGLPVSAKAKRITFDALQWLKCQDLPVPAVVLGSGGTVHLEWSSNGKRLEVGFGDRGIDEYFKVDQHGEVEENDTADFPDAEVRERLEAFAEWLKNG